MENLTRACNEFEESELRLQGGCVEGFKRM